MGNISHTNIILEVCSDDINIERKYFFNDIIWATILYIIQLEKIQINVYENIIQ